MSKKHLSPQEIEHLAKLSSLNLTDEEKEKIAEQFSETLTYIENLKELDTTSVSGLPNVSRSSNIFFEDGQESKRTLSQEEALSNAKKQKDSFFEVDKIL